MLSHTELCGAIADLDKIAELVFGQPACCRAGNIAGYLHSLHGLDAGTEVGSCCGLPWSDVHHNKSLHQTWLGEGMSDTELSMVVLICKLSMKSLKTKCQELALPVQ